ncbi:SCO1/SenC-domain-containing protein [Radiomyces spectabilis]|uniref:SCO1/SenC-domain-containing protein n=1 Tax=Radiomyces spectabilis TaxID=64574 RepID=UPI00221E6B08|nr:SCO1/SenC-domain-containing protein [Radiomyces spectabilis]KAI8378049.1 SCO1/SenC-domain-containing protein [Radiomyces spectabilis]
MSLFTRVMYRSTVRATASRATAWTPCQSLPRAPTATSVLSKRLFSTAKQEASQNKKPPLTWKSAALCVATGAGLVVYFKKEKERVQKERRFRERQAVQSYGRPAIGCPFNLIDADTNQRFSSDQLKGRYYMVYFGFTHCPDICPEELDKMAEVVDLAKADKELGNILVPVFITCDPRRDTPEIIKEYVKDFHPDMKGFTGDSEEIRQVARAFRVYVRVPPDASKDDDYLVDHSIFFYLMDPQGRFVDCYSRDTTPEEVFESFKQYVKDYRAQGGLVQVASS